MSKSFLDEDWTGLTHNQIKSMILSELESEECKANGHLWTIAMYCRNCGEYLNLEHHQQHDKAL